MISGKWNAKPGKFLIYVVSYYNLSGPNTLTLALPPATALYQATPLPPSVTGRRCAWHNLRGPRGKVRVKLVLTQALQPGTSTVATVSLTDGFGNLTTTACSMLVGGKNAACSSP